MRRKGKGNPVRARLLMAGVAVVISSIGLLAATQVQGAASKVGEGIGAFYTDCAFSHRAPDDAIVHPKQPGRSHLHDFVGNTSTDAFSTPASLRSGTTSCGRKADRAAYWFPTLYEGEGYAPITPSGFEVFYTAGPRDFASIQPFPEGLQMIAGDASANERQVGRVIDWKCASGQTLAPGSSSENSARAQALRSAIRGFKGAVVRNRRAMVRLRRGIRRLRRTVRRQRAQGRPVVRQRRVLSRRIRAFRRHRRALRRARAERTNRQNALRLYLVGGGTSIPTCGSNNLALFVRFPDCWDGRNLDSRDHKSHMAYSRDTPGEGWVCPSSHPVLVPMLELHVMYASAGGPELRLSAGDIDAGHADFMNGWDQERLTQLVRDCLNVDKYCGGGDQPVQDKPTPAPSPSPSPIPSLP